MCKKLKIQNLNWLSAISFQLPRGPPRILYSWGEEISRAASFRVRNHLGELKSTTKLLLFVDMRYEKTDIRCFLCEKYREIVAERDA